MTIRVFVFAVCAAAAFLVRGEVAADYAEGEQSTSVLSSNVVTAAGALLGADMAANLIHAVRLQMAKYDRDMKSKNGREQWHGKLVRTEIHTNDLVKVEVYSNEVDGAVWRYRVPFKKRGVSEIRSANGRLVERTVMTNGIPARLARARMRRAKESGVVSNVTVRVTAGHK